jgi:hypothetical protein
VNGGDKSPSIGKFNLAFASGISEFRGKRTVRLKILAGGQHKIWLAIICGLARVAPSVG